MQIDLIGCSSAGKTTLATAMVQACREQGMDAWLSEDFVAQRLRFGWISHAFVRRRLLEVVSLVACLFVWRRYRQFHSVAWRVIREAPGSWLYKAGLVRLTLRKTGIHELIRRHIEAGQVVISDNEAVLQGAHHLFVHPDGANSTALIPAFGGIAPRPEVVVYLRAPEEVLVERTLRRGHGRLGTRPLDVVERFIHRATATFDTLQADRKNGDKLSVVNVEGSVHSAEVVAQDVETLSTATRIVTDGIELTVSNNGQHTGPTDSKLSILERGLFAKLNEEVDYCHWKDNYALAVGRRDHRGLHLLVARSEVTRVQAILCKLGFKQLVGDSRAEELGTWRYVGADSSTGHLVNVHLSVTLESGEKRDGGVGLPHVTKLLENKESLGPVRIPSGESELLIFVIRTFLAYHVFPDVFRVTKQNKEVEEEFHWLASRCSVKQTLVLLGEWFPSVSDTLFLRCLNALHNQASWPKRVRLGRQLRRSLREFDTRRLTNKAGAMFRRFAKVSPRRLGGPTNGWHSGGAVIAFVGADATGKSTLVAATARWLGDAVPINTAHLGKPPLSWQTAPISVAFLVWQRIRGRGRRWKPPQQSTSASRTSGRVGWMSVVYAVRAVALAFDRRRAVMRVQRAAAKRGTVICDRYPCDTVQAMDGPRLDVEAAVGGLRGRALLALARVEARLYRALPPPDLLVKLTVSIEMAKRRNRDRVKADKHPDEELVERHSQRGGSSGLSSNYATEVNTDGSLEETVSFVKGAIWEGL